MVLHHTLHLPSDSHHMLDQHKPRKAENKKEKTIVDDGQGSISQKVRGVSKSSGRIDHFYDVREAGAVMQTRSTWSSVPEMIDLLDGMTNKEQDGKFYFFVVSNTLMVKEKREAVAPLKPHLILQLLILEPIQLTLRSISNNRLES